MAIVDNPTLWLLNIAMDKGWQGLIKMGSIYIRTMVRIWATGFSISRTCVIQLPIFGAEAIPVTPRGVDLVDRGASSRKDAKA
jgi:hypothetical protein